MGALTSVRCSALTGRFNAEDVLDTPVFRDASRRQWEAALKRAKALPQIPALPCITSYHF